MRHSDNLFSFQPAFPGLPAIPCLVWLAKFLNVRPCLVLCGDMFEAEICPALDMLRNEILGSICAYPCASTFNVKAHRESSVWRKRLGIGTLAPFDVLAMGVAHAGTESLAADD